MLQEHLVVLATLETTVAVLLHQVIQLLQALVETPVQRAGTPQFFLLVEMQFSRILVPQTLRAVDAQLPRGSNATG
jgi:hypothetical protein